MEVLNGTGDLQRTQAYLVFNAFDVAVACLQSPGRLSMRCVYPHGWSGTKYSHGSGQKNFIRLKK